MFVIKQECPLCNTLTTDQKAQLATPSYKLKTEKRLIRKNFGEESEDSSTLIDPDHVSNLGAVNPKSPEKVVKEKQKSKKSTKSKSSNRSLQLTRT